MELKWNQELFGVEIKDNENRFVVSAQPNMVMYWDDAVRFYKDNKVWQLPTREQLQLVAKYIDEVNALIRANEGYEIFYYYHWTADEYDEFCAWFVAMNGGCTSNLNKFSCVYVRAVSNL